jgi:hypothetical protein
MPTSQCTSITGTPIGDLSPAMLDGSSSGCAYSDPRNAHRTYSVDGETWNDQSLSELISLNKDLCVGARIFSGAIRYPDPASFLPGADDVVQHMQDQAEGSDHGEWVDDYPSVSEAGMAELTALLAPLEAWARQHCVPGFYLVDDVREHVLTDAEIAAAHN